jgi:hypothetical protein
MKEIEFESWMVFLRIGRNSEVHGYGRMAAQAIGADF